MAHAETSKDWKLIHTLILFSCTVGFIYGAVESWLKYEAQPLSSTTAEVWMKSDPLPSITVCKVGSDMFRRAGMMNATSQELKSEMSMELVLVTQG